MVSNTKPARIKFHASAEIELTVSYLPGERLDRYATDAGRTEMKATTGHPHLGSNLSAVMVSTVDVGSGSCPDDGLSNIGCAYMTKAFKTRNNDKCLRHIEHDLKLG
ncbi:hypothetical protein M8J77_018607 [Diaphorina citri]|nr:hypothetical protein M8J77_018607 [Diaphorina citri]